MGKCSSSLRQVLPAESSSATQLCPHDDEPDEVNRKQKIGRKPGPGKPLQLTKAGKERRKGKGGMITIWQKMQVIKEYERLQAAGVTSPEKHMLESKMFKYQFQGCLAQSKWMGSRKAQHWDDMVLHAPRIAKKMREVPNVLREVMGIKTMKHSRSKFPRVGARHSLPMPLMLAVEDLLIQRMELGEHVDNNYVSGIVDLLSDTWNMKIAELKEEMRRLKAPEIMAAEDAQWDASEDPNPERVAHRMADAVRSALKELEPIERSRTPESCRTPACANSFMWS